MKHGYIIFFGVTALTMVMGAPLAGAALAVLSRTYTFKASHGLAALDSVTVRSSKLELYRKCEASFITRYDNRQSFGDQILYRALGGYHWDYVQSKIEGRRVDRLSAFSPALVGALYACTQGSLLSGLCSRAGKSLARENGEDKATQLASREAKSILESAFCAVENPAE